MLLTEGTLTTGQVAREFGTTSRQVLRWIRQGRLRAVRTPGGHHRVRREDLAALYAVVNGAAR